MASKPAMDGKQRGHVRATSQKNKPERQAKQQVRATSKKNKKRKT